MSLVQREHFYGLRASTASTHAIRKMNATITTRQRKSTQPRESDVENYGNVSTPLKLLPRQRRRKYRSRILFILGFSLAAILIVAAILYSYKRSTEEAIGEEITLHELKKARDYLIEAKRHKLSPLRAIDREKYTVRINTWRRNEQLLASVNHLITCQNIAQIQVVWCDRDNPPPSELLNYATGDVPVVLEHHAINSLNERFRVLSDNTPTYGILSIDDDVLRSCEAIDAGFYRWSDHPDRIIGYDTRVHMISDADASESTRDGTQRIDKNPVWSYGYLSSTRKRNRYSITLPRFCFIHKDYLDLYIEYAPKRVLQTVGKHFNCEDIAMSFFVSALTEGQVPLLADLWATTGMVKLYSESAISGSHDHKMIRDKCVDKFGFLLGLKDGYALLEGDAGHDSKWGQLESQHIMHATSRKLPFGIGADVDHKLYKVQNHFVPSRRELVGSVGFMKPERDLRDKMKALGFIENTPEWKVKWKNK